MELPPEGDEKPGGAQGAVPSGRRSSRAAGKAAETSHPVLQLSISYLSFEQPAGEKSSLRAGQVLGPALLPARASGAAVSSCLPGCTGGTETRSQSNAGAVLGLEVTILVFFKFSLKSGLSPELLLLLLLSPSLSL